LVKWGPGKLRIFLIELGIDECSYSELLNGFWLEGGECSKVPLVIHGDTIYFFFNN